MDLNSLAGLNALNGVGSASALNSIEIGKTAGKSSNVFDSILNSAISNLNTTNGLLSDAENAEVSFALGELDNTHDLVIAIQKAQTALQYTVAVRDKFLEAYKEIMQMQI